MGELSHGLSVWWLACLSVRWRSKYGHGFDKVRDYLEQLAGSARRGQQWEQFEQRCLQSKAQLDGWRFDRDEANER